MKSYLNGNEAENLQNGDVHLAKIPDFEISREPFGTLRSVMARFLAFFTLFVFRREVPFKGLGRMMLRGRISASWMYSVIDRVNRNVHS